MESNIIKIELATRPIKTLLQILYNFFIENYSSTIFKTSILKGLCKIVQHDIMLGSRRIYTKKEINLLKKIDLNQVKNFIVIKCLIRYIIGLILNLKEEKNG